MDSPTTKLWYQLCNTKGEELSDSSSIRLTAEVEIVAELRKAVWNKWKQDALLKDVTAGRLLVYKDKAALDNGTALDGRYKVKDLQETDQQPLQIVVPERVPPTPSGLPNLSSLESKLDVLIKYSDLISRGISSLMEMELSYTEGNETGGSAARQFKTKLVRATMGKTHSKHIIAGHLFKHAWEHLMWMVDLQDINDVRNGLLLYKPIKRAYDDGRICFIYEKGTFTCRLLCKEWKTRTLDSYHPKLERGTQLTAPMTFGDIDGKPLMLGQIQPFKRCLWFQASQARKKAVRRGWIKEDEFEIPDFGGEGDYVEIVKSYLAGVMAAGAQDAVKINKYEARENVSKQEQKRVQRKENQ